jgi:hypothetical protein
MSEDLTDSRQHAPADAVPELYREASETEQADEDVDRSHLEVEDGCGCAEVWEHLSEQREAAERAADRVDET